MSRKKEKTIGDVVLVSRFILGDDKRYSGYIKYIDRDEATRDEVREEYSIYNEYMDNREKTSALFDARDDKLTGSQKEEYKKEFQIAQDNDSVMWQNVISFRNSFLEDNGIYNSKTGLLNEAKLIEVARLSMAEFLEREAMSHSAIWTAAIHYNTEHIHIHFAIVEPQPTRTRGKALESSFRKAKSKVVNNILDMPDIHKQISDLMNEGMLFKAKCIPKERDARFEKEFYNVYSQLKNAGIKYWQYGGKEMKHFKPLIDKLTDIHINSFSKEEYREFKKIIEDTGKQYHKAYGGDEEAGKFEQNKERDFYRKMGNVFLKEMKELDVEIESKKHERAYEKFYEKGNYRKMVNSAKIMRKLKKMLNDERDSFMNQMYYQRMREENSLDR